MAILDAIPFFKALPPWLKWAIFFTCLILVSELLCAVFWFLLGKGEIPKKSDDKTAAINAPATGSKVNQINAPGASNVQQYIAARDVNIYNGVTETSIENAIKKAMDAYYKRKETELSREYPNGLAFFGFTETKQIVPFDGISGSPLNVDWSGGEAGVTMTKTEISLTLPKITLPGAFTISDSTLVFDRIENTEAIIEIGSDSAPTRGGFSHNTIHVSPSLTPVPVMHFGRGESKFLLVVKIARTQTEGVVVLFGAKPAPPVTNLRLRLSRCWVTGKSPVLNVFFAANLANDGSPTIIRNWTMSLRLPNGAVLKGSILTQPFTSDDGHAYSEKDFLPNLVSSRQIRTGWFIDGLLVFTIVGVPPSGIPSGSSAELRYEDDAGNINTTSVSLDFAKR